MKWIVLGLMVATVACSKTPEAPKAEVKVPASATSVAKKAPASVAKRAPKSATSVVKKTPASVAKKAAGGHGRNAPPISFEGPVVWRDWVAGMAEAKAKNRPVMLLIYADWCPKCRALKPGFKDPELVELSKKLVMIKQDSEAKPEWLKTYAEFGKYVPRILFLNPDGSVRRELIGPNTRYPHFYPIQALKSLKRMMGKAGGK